MPPVPQTPYRFSTSSVALQLIFTVSFAVLSFFHLLPQFHDAAGGVTTMHMGSDKCDRHHHHHHLAEGWRAKMGFSEAALSKPGLMTLASGWFFFIFAMAFARPSCSRISGDAWTPAAFWGTRLDKCNFLLCCWQALLLAVRKGQQCAGEGNRQRLSLLFWDGITSEGEQKPAQPPATSVA